MNRSRIITTLLVGVVAFAAMPVQPALAAANATARLTNNTTVYPGEHTYTLTLHNTEPTGTFGIGAGATIRYILVALPTDAGVRITDETAAPTAGNFTARKDVRKNWVEFFNGTLQPGASLTINIPSVVRVPDDCDQGGTFSVKVSSDEGATSRTASTSPGGSLHTKVQVLEIVNGSFKPIAPFDPATGRGVRDGSGTAGQLITYEFKVKNHAANTNTVSGAITSSDPADVPGAAVSKPVASGATMPFEIDIQLGEASTQRTTRFSATATTACAVTPQVQHGFQVQVPVDLRFTGLDPTRVRSGANSGETFTVTAQKTGGPRFELSEGTLTFGANSAGLQEAPRTFDAGNHDAGVQYAIGEIVGLEGPLDATITSEGEDDNLAPVNLVRKVGSITIDLTAPVIRIAQVILPEDVDGDQQIAVKNGDTITVKGSVIADDLVSGCPTVKLVPDAGPEHVLSTTCSDTTDPAGRTFTATVSNATWDSSASVFNVTATMKDVAGNEGQATAEGPYLVDLRRPELGGYASQFKGTVVNATTVSVLFEDDLGFVRGGCDSGSWLVDGQPQVREVRLSSGQVCSGDGSGADGARRSLSDGVRVLVLHDQYAKHPHETPTVTYAPRPRQLGFYPAKDGAQNDALQKTIDTVTEVIPPMPQIQGVERRDGTGYEPAYFDVAESRYYTNAGGADGVRLSWAFTTPVTVPAVTGYEILVTDAAGNTLAQVPATGQNPVSGQWSGRITVPLPVAEGATDGAYERRLFVVSPNGVRSDPPNIITMVLDTELPTLGTRTFNGADKVTVTFSEPIVAGSNFGNDWVITYEIATSEGSELAYTIADSVEVVDRLTRRLVVSLVDPWSYRSTDYEVRFDTHQRYEDRAGNLMQNTI